MLKKYISIILTIVIIMTNTLLLFAASDETALIDPVSKMYKGRMQAKDIIRNINFKDVGRKHWAKEAITRLGALNIVKGYNDNGKYLFRPNDYVSNQEAIAFILRGLGLEGQAQIEAEKLAKNEETPKHILDLWSRGYLTVAAKRGLITTTQLDDALSAEQKALDPKYNFIRANQATREQVAEWLVKAINSYNSTLLKPIRGQQKIYDYNDWVNISPGKVAAVEAVTVNQIMSGYPDGNFKPKGYVTRAQIAQILKNMDDIYYQTQNIKKKNGIIAAIQDNKNLSAGTSSYTRKIKIRTEEGTIEQITYTYSKDSIKQTVNNDVVVYKDGEVAGLMSLKQNDAVEYLADTFNDTMLYIYDKGTVSNDEVSGILQPLTQIKDGYISIGDGNGNTNKFKLIKGLYGTLTNLNGIQENYIVIDKKKIHKSGVPINNWVKLILQNNIVIDIQYIGQQKLYTELKGMVIENNPSYGYITIVDNNNNKITKHYYKNSIKVEKQQYYDEEDEIGYYDEVFPDFRFDPKDTTIDNIEAGDIVYLRLDTKNSDYITSVSAKTNYMMYYGKVEYINSKGIKGTKVHIKFEDLTTTILDVNKDVPIFKADKKVTINDLQPGDWIKVLVNQAVIAPGHQEIKVKEIVIDKGNYYITNIYKGQLSYINTTQNLFYLNDAQKLSKMGWIDYKEQKILDLSSDNVEFYENGKRISKDYAEHFLKYNGEVYVAMEDNYGSEVVKKVAFRNERDVVLKSDSVIYSNGAGNVKLDNYKSMINTDDGTLIIRNGRLVNEQNIMVPDYALVVLNGKNKAAVIDITPQPTTDEIQVYRGRIASVNEGESFQVQSHAELKNMTWTYSPVRSRFTFDHYTKFLDDSGLVNIDEFIDYTENSKVDEVYTVFTKGTKAQYIVDDPYVKEGVRGEIYKIEGNKLLLRDTYYFDQSTKSWKDFSKKNIGSEVNIPLNSVIIRNGKFISSDELELGDKIKVMTDENLYSKFIKNATKNVEGYIIFVEG